MKFHFINPSEFIAGGPKNAKKPPLWQYLSSAVVEGPYREVCSPLWISLQKSASFSGFLQNHELRGEKTRFFRFFFNYFGV